MKKLKLVKSLPSLHNIHVQDQSIIIDFLNLNYQLFGAIKYLGSFINEIKVSNAIGIKGIIKFLVVERTEYVGESPGNKHEFNGNGIREIFKMPFDLPDSFSVKQEEENFVILSSVQNHSCDPNERCVSCEGSGKCFKCDGRGYNRCTSCDGTGKKEIADGHYANGNPKYKKIACHSCHGAGRNSCHRCNGSAKCYKCDGHGIVICSRCDGTSVYQTYLGYSNAYKVKDEQFCFCEDETLKDAVLQSKNRIAFDDELIEWENEDQILFDKRETAFKINKHSKPLFELIEEIAKLKPNQKTGRVYSVFETVPITSVNYSFENIQYSLSIIGENNLVCFESVPTKHNYSKNIVNRILDYFSKDKRKIAFIYIASYIFNADQIIDDSEIKLFELLLNNMKLNYEKRNHLTGVLQRQLTLEDIKPHIKIVQSDFRALIFAWQCVLQDGQIVESEVEAFNALAKLFKVNESQLEELKHKAMQFGNLSEVEMIEEYFRE